MSDEVSQLKTQEYCLFIDKKEVQREFVARLQDSVDLRGGILRIYSEPDQIGVFNTPCLYAPEGIFHNVNSINNFSAYLRRKEEEGKSIITVPKYLGCTCGSPMCIACVEDVNRYNEANGFYPLRSRFESDQEALKAGYKEADE